jgi:uncharacterized DUF497 family protein
MKPKLILPAQDKITIVQDKHGVEIHEVNQMLEDSAVFISYERLEKVIACLHQIHMKRQPKDWKD